MSFCSVSGPVSPLSSMGPEQRHLIRPLPPQMPPPYLACITASTHTSHTAPLAANGFTCSSAYSPPHPKVQLHQTDKGSPCECLLRTFHHGGAEKKRCFHVPIAKSRHIVPTCVARSKCTSGQINKRTSTPMSWNAHGGKPAAGYLGMPLTRNAYINQNIRQEIAWGCHVTTWVK